LCQQDVVEKMKYMWI